MSMLKQCPWCGATGSYHKEPLWHGSHGYVGNYEYYIQCSNPFCGAIAPNGKVDDIYREEMIAREEAIIKWNTRYE